MRWCAVPLLFLVGACATQQSPNAASASIKCQAPCDTPGCGLTDAEAWELALLSVSSDLDDAVAKQAGVVKRGEGTFPMSELGYLYGLELGQKIAQDELDAARAYVQRPFPRLSPRQADEAR